MVLPTGTQLVVRLATDVSSATASVGDRFQGFLDLELAADGRLVAPRGGAVYGIVTAVERGSKSGKDPSLSMTLTDMKVGDRIVSIKTQPISLKGEASKAHVRSSAAQCLARRSAGSPQRRGRCDRRSRRDRCRCGRSIGWVGQGGGHAGPDSAGVHSGRPAPGGHHDKRGGSLRGSL